MPYDEQKYFEAKEDWDNFFCMLSPRNDSEEEVDAFVNAMEDAICEL